MKLPEFLRKPAGPLTILPEQKLVSGYFNLDNGIGKDSRRIPAGKRSGRADLCCVDRSAARVWA